MKAAMREDGRNSHKLLWAIFKKASVMDASSPQPTPPTICPPTCAQDFYMQSDTQCKWNITFSPLVKNIFELLVEW